MRPPRRLLQRKKGLYCGMALAMPLVLGAADLQGAFPVTYTRGSAASVRDFEGVLRYTLSGEIRSYGARRVRNRIAANSGLDVWSAGVPTGWAKAVDASTTEVDGWNGSGSAAQFTATVGGNVGTNRLTATGSIVEIGRSYILHARARRTTGSSVLLVALDGIGTFTIVPAAAVNGQWGWFSTQVIAATAAVAPAFFPNVANEVFEIDDVQLEDVTGQANQNPSEYVPVGLPLPNELIHTEDPSQATWSITSGGGAKSVVAGPDGRSVACRVTVGATSTTLRITGLTGRTIATGTKVSGGFWIRKNAGSSTNFVADFNDATIGTRSITGDWTYINVENITSVSATTPFIDIVFVVGPWTAGDTIDIAFPHYMQGTVNLGYKPCGLYLYNGWGVDGVAYFPYENGNTVAANIVTPGQGANISNTGVFTEDTSTNFLLWCQDFTTTWSTNSSGTISSNATTAPDGFVTADKLVEDTDNTDHFVFQSITKAASALDYTFSVFAKAAERTQIRLLAGDSTYTDFAVAYFDLSAGTTTGASVSGFTNESAGIEAWPDGWYRCYLTFRTDTDTTLQSYIGMAIAGNPFYLGDGASGVYLWHAQLERSLWMTMPIVSTTAAATRNTDDFDILNILKDLDKTGVTIAVHGTHRIMSDHYAMALHPANGGNPALACRTNATSYLFMVRDTGGGVHDAGGLVTATVNTPFGMAISCTPEGYVDGAANGQSTSGPSSGMTNLDVLTSIQIGQGYNSARFNGPLETALVFIVPKTASQLRAISGR